MLAVCRQESEVYTATYSAVVKECSTNGCTAGRCCGYTSIYRATGSTGWYESTDLERQSTTATATAQARESEG